jgi:hypothetical protein
MSYTAKKQESSLPMLLGFVALLGLGYVLGMPAVAEYLPKTIERPMTKFHEEANKSIESVMRGFGIGS